MVGNIISGLVGGGVLGQIVTLLLPSVVAAAQSGNLSVGGVVSQVVAGGAGGAEQGCCLTVKPKIAKRLRYGLAGPFTRTWTALHPARRLFCFGVETRTWGEAACRHGRK